MDKVTQQNAASAEESASASEEMNRQAAELKALADDLVGLVKGNRIVNRGGLQGSADYGSEERDGASVDNHRPQPRLLQMGRQR